MKPNQIGPVNSLQEFMEAIWRIPKTTETVIRVYRGQSNTWELLPKLFRVDLEGQELRPLETMLVNAFIDRSLYLMPSAPTGYYDRLSLAQHYGLPTRLLDWSSNPLIGLFFALDALQPQNPTVWIYDGSQRQRYSGIVAAQGVEHKESQSDVFIIKPATHSHRVVAQAGWHTVHPFFSNDQEATPMERSPEATRLSVVTIAPDKARDIRSELRSMGIHAATVYGDLTSVCKEIQDELEIPQNMRRDVSVI